MKRIVLVFVIIMATVSTSHSQSSCPGNMLINPQFSAGLSNWTQYGLVTNAGVLNAHVACLDTFLTLQATTNSNCGVEQTIALMRDSCYSICYCVEFPGSTFNSKLTIAAIMPGVTVSQLLSGTFSPGQAQIIDVVYATSGVPAYNRCAGTFKAAGSFTGFVIVNETIGPVGSDVRVDNLCLLQDSCVASCASVNANFAFATGMGNTVSFTDISTSNPGDVLSWTWDFGDPPSGPANTSNLQNPSHTYPSPGTYTVCLYLNDITTVGIVCNDTICININIGTTGIQKLESARISVAPNPAADHVTINGAGAITEFTLYNTYGQEVWRTVPSANTISLPSSLANGIYDIAIRTDRGMIYKKLAVFHN